MILPNVWWEILILFSQKKTIQKRLLVLREFGYSDEKLQISFSFEKHYRRLQKENNIAAIEIHKELLYRKIQQEFNYSFVEKDSQVINAS